MILIEMFRTGFRAIQITFFIFSAYLALKNSKNKNNNSTSHNNRKKYKAFVAKLEKMGPAFIKLGQGFATRIDLIDEDLAKELLALCDNVSPEPFSYVKQTIEEEFKKNLDEIFLEFNEIPVASASIAQVHKAKIRYNYEEWIDGKPIIKKETKTVAVKVLRPNVEEIFKRDVKLLFIVVRAITGFIPKRLKPMEIIRRFASNVNAELDLRMEAASASELKQNTRNDIGFYVPEIYWDYTTRNIFTLEWIEGTPLTQITEDKYKVVERLVLIFFKQVYRDGFFHADIHPGNIIIMPDLKIAVVDFGIMGRMDKESRLYLIEIVRGFIDRDYNHIAEIHFEAGYVSRKYLNFATACRAIGEPIVGKPLNQISIASLLAQLFKLASDFEIEVQPNLLLVQKNLMLLEGNCYRLDDNSNMWSIIAPFIKQWYIKEMSVPNRLRARLADTRALIKDMLNNGIKVRIQEDLERRRSADPNSIYYNNNSSNYCYNYSGGYPRAPKSFREGLLTIFLILLISVLIYKILLA